jgi:hypothetical protein
MFGLMLDSRKSGLPFDFAITIDFSGKLIKKQFI